MYNRILSEEVNTALSEVRDRLWAFYRYPFRFDRQEAVDKVMKDIKNECVADFNRNTQYDISRIEPVSAGQAINLIPSAFQSANIWMVDASTRFGLDVIPKFSIHAKAFRPFIPQKGKKSDKSHFSLIQSSLNTENKDAEIVKKIINIGFDDNGMFDNPPEELSLYSPRICLVYGNMDGHDRMVFMLRPSSNRLTRVAYRAYCYVVMSAMVKRIYGSRCDLDFWSKLDTQNKMAYSQSMMVTDSMLVTKHDEMTRYPLIHKQIKMERFAITPCEFFAEVA
jgi:hypothetical protein